MVRQDTLCTLRDGNSGIKAFSDLPDGTFQKNHCRLGNDYGKRLQHVRFLVIGLVTNPLVTEPVLASDVLEFISQNMEEVLQGGTKVLRMKEQPGMEAPKNKSGKRPGHKKYSPKK